MRANFLAWLATIRLYTGALGLDVVLENATFTLDSNFVRTLAYFNSVMIDSITTDTKADPIHGNAKLHRYQVIHAIHKKLNRM